MDAVGDVADRHVGDRALRPQVLPHPARDLAVAAADAVGRAARAQRELADAERLALVVGTRAAEPDDLVARRRPARRSRPLSASSTWSAGYVSLPAGTGVCVVKIGPSRDGVESRRRARRRWARAASSDMNAAWPSLRWSEARLDPHRGERAHAADAEQDVLREPRVGLADVEPRRDPAGGEVVLRALGVEQVERHAADVDAPDLRGHLQAADRDGDR